MMKFSSTWALGQMLLLYIIVCKYYSIAASRTPRARGRAPGYVSRTAAGRHARAARGSLRVAIDRDRSRGSPTLEPRIADRRSAGGYQVWRQSDCASWAAV